MTAARTQRILLRTVVALAVVLAVTGVWLSFFYRPDAAQAWSDLDLAPGSVDWPRLLHQAAAVLIILVAVALLVVGVVVRRGWRPAGALLGLTLALAYTGLLLPWDQLALWAVTVGENFRGMWSAAFDDDVRFVLINGFEISQTTLRLWLLVHSAALPVAFAVTLALLVGASYRRSSPSLPATSSGR